MDKIYRLKENIEFQSLIDAGFQTNDWSNFYKVVPVEQELADFLLQKFYQNPKWIENIYKPNKKEIIKTINLKYTKDGKIKNTKEMNAILNNWCLEACEEDDFWLGFSSLDPSDTYVYYNRGLVDKYFPEEVKLLKSLNLLEEYEVEPITVKNEG